MKGSLRQTALRRLSATGFPHCRRCVLAVLIAAAGGVAANDKGKATVALACEARGAVDPPRNTHNHADCGRQPQ